MAAELGVADALAGGTDWRSTNWRQPGGCRIRGRTEPAVAGLDRAGRLPPAAATAGIKLNSLARNAAFGCRRDLDGLRRPSFYGSSEQRERWTLLVDSIRTGRSVVPTLHGNESFDYFAEDPEHADLFNRTMASISRLTDASVAAGYDFGAYPTIVDVGGGHGLLLATILSATPGVKGVLYDLPAVVAAASKRLCYNGLADRVRIDPGSFFDKVPAGGDAYLLKNILHDWPDDKAVQILRNVHAAAGRHATVLLVELVIPDHDRDFPGKWADLEMLLNLGARERTAAEYRNLLGQAGFEMTRLVATASPLSLVEARAV